MRSIALVLGLALLAGASPAVGQTQDEIGRRLTELERARQELESKETDLRNDVAADLKRRSALTDELAELQAIVDEAQSSAYAAANQLAGLESTVADKDAELDGTARMLEAERALMQKRAIDVYKRGPASFVAGLLETRSISDFARRVSLVSSILRSDARRIERVEALRGRLEREREDLEQVRDRAASQAVAAASARDRAAAVRDATSTRRAQVSAELGGSYHALGAIAQQRQAFERETAELQARSATIAGILKGRGTTGAGAPSGMIWPVSGPITSGYGWRTHPVFGSRRFHAGIDIGASSGTAISAAAPGTVVASGEQGGYGIATIVDHGGGIATTYAHQTASSVSVGQVVEAGQRIGAVGCTGYCTGPHLHFEVRQNGDPVDPMGWLP